MNLSIVKSVLVSYVALTHIADAFFCENCLAPIPFKPSNAFASVAMIYFYYLFLNRELLKILNAPLDFVCVCLQQLPLQQTPTASAHTRSHRRIDQPHLYRQFGLENQI